MSQLTATCLRYLETDGVGAEIRPWFWIIWLLAGPMLQSLIFQYELFVTTNVLVRLEGLFTQLVFNHSLRIRLKAETSNDPDSKSNSRASSIREASSEATTPDNGSIAESSEHGRDPSEASTLIASHEADASTSTSTAPKKAAKGKGKAEEETKAPEKSNENLIGKINNLITTDLNYITGGQDFLMISTSCFFEDFRSDVDEGCHPTQSFMFLSR